ncbi:MAG: Mth938-like domain-containing protein [Gemmatimonadota bacterium]
MTQETSRPNASPRIRRVAWGRIEVEGAEAPYKDAKLWPGGSREWDWNETGTRHEPGIQPADVQELLANGARTVVLSRGVQRRLKVRPDTLEMLEEKGVTAHVLPTEEAVRLYNELREGEAVGGLFHSTC